MSANGPIDQHLSRFMPIFDDNADLQCKPELDKVFLAEMGKTLTCGDMHANAKKFFYILVRHGFIDVSKEDYDLFVRIYDEFHTLHYELETGQILNYERLRQLYTDFLLNPSAFVNPDNPVTENDFLDALQAMKQKYQEIWADLLKLLDRIGAKSTAIGSFLRLLGDFSGDRGSLDLITWAVKIVLKEKVKDLGSEILLSNHDMELIRCMEMELPFDEMNMSKHLTNSSWNIQALIDLEVLSREDVFKLYQDVYLKDLKLLSYSYFEGVDHAAQFVLYSHAHVGFNTVEYMARKLGVEYFPGSLTGFMQTVDQINEVFTEKYVKQNKISELVEIDKAINADGRKRHLMRLIKSFTEDKENQNPRLYQLVCQELAIFNALLDDPVSDAEVCTLIHRVKFGQPGYSLDNIENGFDMALQRNFPFWFCIWNRNQALVNRPTKFFQLDYPVSIYYGVGHDSSPAPQHVWRFDNECGKFQDPQEPEGSYHLMSYHGAHPSLPSERFLHNSAGEGMLVESLEKFLAEGSDASRKRGSEEDSPNVSPLLLSK